VIAVIAVRFPKKLKELLSALVADVPAEVVAVVDVVVDVMKKTKLRVSQLIPM
jgi:hypothetical protein